MPARRARVEPSPEGASSWVAGSKTLIQGKYQAPKSVFNGATPPLVGGEVSVVRSAAVAGPSRIANRSATVRQQSRWSASDRRTS